MNTIEEIIAHSRWAHDWATTIAIVGFVYLIGVHVLPSQLEARQPCRGTLFRNVWAFWNQALAAQSFITCIVALGIVKSPEFSWHSLICDPQSNVMTQALETQIVKYIFVPFVLSKIVELGDTVFLLLAHKPVLFLHWFHHVTVLMFCWLNMMYPNTSAFLFVLMNSAVHTIMQTYYGLMIHKQKLPSWIAKCVTTLQTSQMFIGTFATVQAVVAKSFTMCFVPTIVTLSGCVMYTVYAFLFVQFATNRYKAE